MPKQTTETFKGLLVHRTTTFDKLNTSRLQVLIKPDMEEESGWDYTDHIKWVNELTKLKIPFGSIIVTDEQCTEVWLLSRDHYKTKCRLIHSDEIENAKEAGEEV